MSVLQLQHAQFVRITTQTSQTKRKSRKLISQRIQLHLRSQSPCKLYSWHSAIQWFNFSLFPSLLGNHTVCIPPCNDPGPRTDFLTDFFSCFSSEFCTGLFLWMAESQPYALLCDSLIALPAMENKNATSIHICVRGLESFSYLPLNGGIPTLRFAALMLLFRGYVCFRFLFFVFKITFSDASGVFFFHRGLRFSCIR